MSDISTSIFNAVDILVSKALSEYEADISNSYIICDASKAEFNQYTVSNSADSTKGTVSFEVYKQANDDQTYKVGDSVYVLIPGGDYTQKKFILGLATNQVTKMPTPSSAEAEADFVALNTMIDFALPDSSVKLEAPEQQEVNVVEEVVLDKPIYLCNYKKLRISATLKANIGKESDLIPSISNSASYSIEFRANDGKQIYTYALSSKDILGNIYHFGKNYYSFSKDIIIPESHFNISSYGLYLVQDGIFKNASGDPLNSEIEIKAAKVELGMLKTEYEDGLFIYEKDNMTHYNAAEGEVTANIGVKINYGEKEYLDDSLIIDKKETSVSWLNDEKVYSGYNLLVSEGKQLKFTSDSAATTSIKAELREKINGIVTQAIFDNTKLHLTSNTLKFDNEGKISYDYSIEILSEDEKWDFDTDTEEITLKASLSQVGQKFTEKEDAGSPYEEYCLYKTSEGKYFIWTGNAKKNVVFSWYKDEKELEGSDNTIIVNKDEVWCKADYRCEAEFDYEEGGD